MKNKVLCSLTRCLFVLSTAGLLRADFPPTAAPVFSPAAGTYTSAPTVTITSATSDAYIIYTTDGSIPTYLNGTLYSGPIFIGATTTLNAFAQGSGINVPPSPVTSGIYTIDLPSTAAPTFCTAAGIYPNAQTVTIASTTSGASIRYTTDGSTPTETNGTLYSGPVSISQTTMLKAIAYVTGFTADSPVTSGLYAIIISPVACLNVLYDFTKSNSGGWGPDGLVQGSDGNFYGTTYFGGSANKGTVFKMTPAGVLTTLVSFNGTNGHSPLGLLQGSDGNFYGTADGGSANDGIVFMMTPSGALTTLVSFGGANGANPVAGLVQGSDGNFYGTTASGGSTNNGTVFKMTPAGALITLVSFDGTNGANPEAGLVQGSDDNFYGTTAAGGIHDNGPGDPNGNNLTYGTIFMMTPTGVLTTLVLFNGTSDGYEPEAPLVQGSDGNFYGTTIYGGGAERGTVFKMTPAGVLTTLASFNGANGADPVAGLVQGSDGNFYGTAEFGGSANYNGTIFKMTPAGVLTTLVLFDGANGAQASSSLVQGSDGNFYGTTQGGGIFNSGTLFQLIISPQVGSPAFSPAGGTYASAQSVTITSAGATAIYYTTDGTAPTTASTLYAAPISIANNTVLQAIGVNNGGASPVTSATYTILPPAPVFSPAPGTSPNVTSLSVTISDAASATIYYTTDGSTPAMSSAQYAGTVVLPIGTTTLSAIAVTDNGVSDVITGTYVLTPPPPLAPVFSPAGGTYASAQSVTITSAGATAIYYTTDGTAPTTASTLYAAPISIANNTVLQAIGINSGGPGPVATVSFTILPQVAAPMFSPDGGEYRRVQRVTISTVTNGASIRYTLDGSVPAETNGTLYFRPVVIIHPATLKAIAYEIGFTDSTVTSGIYAIDRSPTELKRPPPCHTVGGHE